jgi:hypothetical protein
MDAAQDRYARRESVMRCQLMKETWTLMPGGAYMWTVEYEPLPEHPVDMVRCFT